MTLSPDGPDATGMELLSTVLDLQGMPKTLELEKDYDTVLNSYTSLVVHCPIRN